MFLVVHFEGPLQIRREFFVELGGHLTSRLDSPGRLAGVLIERFLRGGICRMGRNRHHGIGRDGLDKFDPDLVWVDSLMVEVLCGSLAVESRSSSPRARTSRAPGQSHQTEYNGLPRRLDERGENATGAGMFRGDYQRCKSRRPVPIGRCLLARGKTPRTLTQECVMTHLANRLQPSQGAHHSIRC